MTKRFVLYLLIALSLLIINWSVLMLLHNNNLLSWSFYIMGNVAGGILSGAFSNAVVEKYYD